MKLKASTLALLLILCLSAKAQMANLLDSALLLFSSPQTNNYTSLEEKTSFETRNLKTISPLGPKAQILRSHTYMCRDNPKSGIWIKHANETFYFKDNALFESKKARIPIPSSKLNKKVKKVLRSLQILTTRSGYARNIIQSLQQSPNRFTISIVNATTSYTLFPLPNGRFGVLNNNAYAFQIIETDNLVVDYANFDQIGSGAEIRWRSKDNTIKLAHELSHAYDANFGLVDDRLTMINGMTMSVREIRALYHENMIRKEMNKGYRIKVNNGQALIAGDQPFTHPLPYQARH